MQKAASLASVGAPWVVTTRPIPKAGKDQLLVKVVAVGLNPFDGFMQVGAYPMEPEHWPIIGGWDVAGTVEEVGEGVTGYAKGDRVLFQADFHPDKYGFQEYCLTEVPTTAKIPSNVSFEQAATIPLCFPTAAIGLYGKRASANSRTRGGAGLVAPWNEGGRDKYKDEPILVTAGASCLGQYIIQLAKLSGFNPIITTASAHNTSYCEAAGATHVIDYHSTPYPSLASAVASITPKPIKVIYDAAHAASYTDACIACWSILAPGGTFIAAMAPPKEIGAPGVADKDGKYVAWLFGSVSDDVIGDVTLGRSMFGALEGLLEREEIRPTRVEVLEGGLTGINEGLQRLLGGKVSGAKLVVRIADTP